MMCRQKYCRTSQVTDGETLKFSNCVSYSFCRGAVAKPWLVSIPEESSVAGSGGGVKGLGKPG